MNLSSYFETVLADNIVFVSVSSHKTSSGL